MKRRIRLRSAVAGIATTLVTFSLGVTLAVVVTGSASALSTTTTTTTTATSGSPGTTPSSMGLDPKAGRFSVINGTVNAASDHEIVASSAFPNYTTGAVDNYYSLAHSHLDNSPFAEATASPADTGPIGQTAAAGNFQQSQYADARWPGGPDKATYGSQGEPYAAATAGDYLALADASAPSRALTGPELPVPKGFDGKLQQALAQWKKKWQSVLGMTPTPPVTTPKTVTTPVTTVTTPKPTVPTTPTVTVTTPIGTVTTPGVAGAANPAPAAPAPSVPSVGATGPPRSVASASTSSPDGESLLTSSTQAALVPEDRSQTGIPEIDPTQTETTQTETTRTVTDPAKLKPHTLVMRGESSLGRVRLGGGQIVISGIHVKAAIANDGTTTTPAYEASVSVGAASIGGVPVTIDQDGVHIAGNKQGVPYQQASDSLNGALKQAGIQLFLVSPQVTTSSCGQPGTGTATGTTSTTTTTTSTDPSGTTSSCGMCPQTGTGTDTGTTGTTTTMVPTSTNQSSTTTAPTSCDQAGAPGGCDQAVTGTGTTTTTTTAAALTSTTPTSTNQSGTTTTPSWCAPSATTSSCPTATATRSTTTNSSAQSTTTGTASDPTGATGATTSSEETVTATGLHVVFTQPASPPGVPAQYVEHILGEVFVDSLATLAPPLPSLDLSPSASSSSSPCLGGRHSHGGTKSGGAATTAGGSSSAGGSTASGSGSLSPSASSLGSGSQLSSGSGSPSGSTGGSFPAAVVAALKKPLWLLLAYVLWQAIVIATGASLWHWRRGGAS